MSFKYPFINPCKGYIKMINRLRVYYSTLIFYSVPYPVLVEPDRHLTLPYSLYLIILLVYPIRTSNRRTSSHPFLTLPHLLTAPDHNLTLPYPNLYSPHLTVPLPYPTWKNKRVLKKGTRWQNLFLSLQLSAITFLDSALYAEARKRFHDCLQSFERFCYQILFCKTLFFSRVPHARLTLTLHISDKCKEYRFQRTWNLFLRLLS